MMPINIFKKKQKRACVIGLDGVPCSLIQDLMSRGVMPRTREIAARGAMRPMTVTLPEISSVSWSTFMTARNPGEHGIFGFTDLKDASYGIRFPSFRDVKTPTIWDALGTKGMKSVVINQPSTYPARPIPGVLISGFVAVEMEKSVAPLSYYYTLQKSGYEIDVDTQKCAKDPALLFQSLAALLAGRRRVMDDLWTREQWNLMEVVITGTDRLHHFLWDAYEDENHAHHGAFLDYYRAVDDFIHHAFTRFQETEPAGDFFILSDHGFCGTRNEIYVNAVLQKEGFLSLPAGGSLDAIDEKTRAFALDPARIYINRKGRFPKGGVGEGDVAPLVRDIAAVFKELSVNGETIVRFAASNEEAYTGPFAAKGPDLLLVPNNGFDLKGRIGSPDIVGERKLQGMHTWDNAFFFSLDAGVFEGDGAGAPGSAGEGHSGAGAGPSLAGAIDGGGGSSRALNIVDAPKKILRKLDVEI